VQPAPGVLLAGQGSRAAAHADPAAALTEREREVLSLLAIGHTNPEIATLLYLSPRTVESHRANIQRKLGVRSRADLVRAAAEIEESEGRTGEEDGRSHPPPP
jgi:two-component system, NarL family, response regulator NreC